MIHVAHLLRKIRYLCFCLVCAMPFPAAAAETIFTVQPILEHSTMLKLYTPLASFLAKASQKPVELRLAFDFPEYWFRLKGGKEFDIVFDGPFYTDYLIQAHGYIPLVKLPGTVSFSLIARSSDGFFDASELVGKRIATLTPPAPTTLFLSQLFTNPTRQPKLVATRSNEAAVELLNAGKVSAAMVPTPLAAKAMAENPNIATVLTTEHIPHMAISVSPRVDAATRERLRNALVNAKNTPEGQALLKLLGFHDGFETTSAEVFKGFGKELGETWGITASR